MGNDREVEKVGTGNSYTLVFFGRLQPQVSIENVSELSKLCVGLQSTVWVKVAGRAGPANQKNLL